MRNAQYPLIDSHSAFFARSLSACHSLCLPIVRCMFSIGLGLGQLERHLRANSWETNLFARQQPITESRPYSRSKIEFQWRCVCVNEKSPQFAVNLINHSGHGKWLSRKKITDKRKLNHCRSSAISKVSMSAQLLVRSKYFSASATTASTRDCESMRHHPMASTICISWQFLTSPPNNKTIERREFCKRQLLVIKYLHFHFGNGFAME